MQNSHIPDFGIFFKSFFCKAKLKPIKKKPFEIVMSKQGLNNLFQVLKQTSKMFLR